MTNLKGAKARVYVVDSRTLTVTKRGDWHVYHRRDMKLYIVMLSNTAVMTCLHINLFIMTQELQKGFQMTL